VVLQGLSCGDELQAGIRRIYEAFGNSFSQSLKMTGQLYLLLELLTEEAGEDKRQKGRDADVVRSAIGFIDQRYSYAISVEDVADYAGVSRSTLFRIFTRYLEISPKEYLDSYRIRKAMYLLKETDLTIGAIAVSVGYDNGLYFSKAFHKMTGQSPSLYRSGRPEEEASAE
jgi:AraC-like DNA-binding protein